MNEDEDKALVGVAEPCMPRVPTIRESLIADKDRLSRQLESVEAAIKALDDFPQFELVHDAITKAGSMYRLR